LPVNSQILAIKISNLKSGEPSNFAPECKFLFGKKEERQFNPSKFHEHLGLLQSPRPHRIAPGTQERLQHFKINAFQTTRNFYPSARFIMKKIFCVAVALIIASFSVRAAEKKIVLIAGKPSHGPGQHEHNAGVLLLQKCLNQIPGIKTDVHLNGWPEDDDFFDGADAIVLYMDGGPNHPALQDDRLKKLDSLMKKGVGLACLHYATEPTIEKGEKEFLDWIGGAFEINWSVNPHWDADFETLPKHPITRGVKPFAINDEWYFHLRFRDGMKGVTPILSAVAPESTMTRGEGEHEGNPAVRESVKRGELQTVAWAATRKNGGRGFGLTGGHVHTNWGNENFRKLVLNAILWIAHDEVPANGVESKITDEDLKKNLDPKGAKKK
jgi:type 1 glutamine amidotransferase